MAAPAVGSPPLASLGRALRDAALAGFLAFALFVPLIGFNTVQNMRNELVLETRFELLAILVAIVAGGAFLNALLLEPWRLRRAEAARLQSAIKAPREGPKIFAPLAILFCHCLSRARLRIHGAERGEMDR